MDESDGDDPLAWARFIPGPIRTVAGFVLGAIVLPAIFVVGAAIGTLLLLLVAEFLSIFFPQAGSLIYAACAVLFAVIIRRRTPADPKDEAEDLFDSSFRLIAFFAALRRLGGSRSLPDSLSAGESGYAWGTALAGVVVLPLNVAITLLGYVVAFSQMARWYWFSYGGFAVSYTSRTDEVRSVGYWLKYGLSWIAGDFNISQALNFTISDVRTTTLVTRIGVVGVNVVLVFVLISALKKTAQVIPALFQYLRTLRTRARETPASPDTESPHVG